MMKRSDLPRVIGAGTLTLGLLVLPEALPASAQKETANPTQTIPAANPPGDTTPDQANEGDRKIDWGWLGLIGLAGLAGLARKRTEPRIDRDPNL